MIYTSLAVLALSASAAVTPLSHVVHIQHAKPVDSRVRLTLMNESMMHRDVTVAGETYTMDPRTSLIIQAPAGTKVYSASLTPQYKVGQVMLEVSPDLNGQTVVLN